MSARSTWLVVLVLLASSCSSDGSSRTSTPDATQGPPSSTEPSTSTVAPVTETSSGVAPPTTAQTESTLDVRWEGFPLFVFPGSIHIFRFILDQPADSVDVVTSATGTIPATFSAEVGQWLAVAAAPDTGPWTFTVEATIEASWLMPDRSSWSADAAATSTNGALSSLRPSAQCFHWSRARQRRPA